MLHDQKPEVTSENFKFYHLICLQDKIQKISYSARKESRFPTEHISLHRNGVYEHRQSKDIVRYRQETF